MDAPQYFKEGAQLRQVSELKLYGSGGYILADITPEQEKKADLGVGKLFFAPIGKLEPDKMLKYSCKTCQKEFDGAPQTRIEESANEAVADNLILVERGQYVCRQCGGTIGEYRVFKKNDKDDSTGNAIRND